MNTFTKIAKNIIIPAVALISQPSLTFANNPLNEADITDVLTDFFELRGDSQENQVYSPLITNDYISSYKPISNELVSDSKLDEQKQLEVFKYNYNNIQQSKQLIEGLHSETMYSSNANLQNSLNITTILEFAGKWQEDRFHISKNQPFTSFDNQQLQVDYINNDVMCLFSAENTDKIEEKSWIHEKSSNNKQWSIIRTFYKKNNYALDIILPHKNSQMTNQEKITTITKLLTQLNNQTQLHHISLEIPMFVMQQQTNNNTMLKKIYPNFDGNTINLQQKCIMKVNQKLSKEVGYLLYGLQTIIVDSGFYYILSELEDTLEINKSKITNKDSCKIKKIVMIGAVNNPSLEN